MRDTGEGILEENFVRVINPFSTTKVPGKGPGLGLSMVQGFVSQSGVEIRIVSQLGERTSVHLFIPEVPEYEGFLEPALGSSSLILLVKDEVDVRNVTKGFLETLEYDVLAVADPASALEAIWISGPFAAAVIDQHLGSDIFLDESWLGSSNLSTPDCRTIPVSGLEPDIRDFDSELDSFDHYLR